MASMNNREWAALFWILVLAVWASRHREFRSRLQSVLRLLLGFEVLLPLILMLAYIAGLVWLGWRLGLWTPDLFKGTVIWFLASALVLFFNLPRASAETGFFRRKALRTLEITVFLAFFLNVFVLNLVAELFLQPVILVLTMLSLVAAGEARYLPVKKLADGLLSLIGFSVAAFVLVQLFRQWDQLDKTAQVFEFALPVCLTLGLLPFIYVMSLFMAYGAAFVRINPMLGERLRRRRAKLALISVIHARTRRLQGFGGHWARQAGSANSFKQARNVVKEFVATQRRQEAEAREEKDRLKRYAGVAGIDSEGRQLDRREFEETTSALRWLATCQMGWYRSHGARYRADMLDILGNDFRSHGLPEEHGITLHVARHGKSWWAWRRTITGWCFAIGAAGPPPDQWEHDGPEPPEGFPGEDERWGENPFSLESNPNW
jgi:hypothetical protein